MRKLLLIPYGKEISFYQRTTTLWRARIPNPQGWSIITYRFAPELAIGTFDFDGSDLLIAEHPGISGAIKSDRQRFALSGSWSEQERLHFIFRRIMVSRFLLATFEGDFIAYFTTSTSVINLNLLDSVDFYAPKRRYVAGQFLRWNLQHHHFYFPSGSGFITNRLGVACFAEQSTLIPIYDDVWTGIILQHFDQIRFPRMDITHPNFTSDDSISQYQSRVARTFKAGIWHVRVKLQDNRVTDPLLQKQIKILELSHQLATQIDCASFNCRTLLSEPI